LAKKNISLPEVFLSDSSTTLAVSQMVKAGEARKVGPRLYTRNMVESTEVIISRNRWQIVRLLAPGSVIGFRTAFEGRPAGDGSIFVTGRYKRLITLPGLRIVQNKGACEVAGDMPFMDGLFMASQARYLMENLAPTKVKEATTRSVGQEGIEGRLTEILRVRRESELNKIRDHAREIAPFLGLEKEFEVLDRIIGSLMQTKKTKLITPVAKAYANGEPYDSARIERFNILRGVLASNVLASRQRAHTPEQAFYNESFFDAYFSNFIEGTEFLVEEAIEIVFAGVIPKNRPEDAHDILGTYKVVGNYDEMRRVTGDFQMFLELLQGRHSVIMEGRPHKRPGEFKEEGNRAGATVFVAPELVHGTLRQGFDLYRSLEDPLARALYMMYLVSEVHPFDDGNGRVSRAMMNSELIAAGMNRVIIPSIYRNEYIASLRLMTNHNDPSSFIRVMVYAQEFVSRIDFSDLGAAKRVLEACNAFEKPDDNIKLKLPDPMVTNV
jgi:hypothetical protein